MSNFSKKIRTKLIFRKSLAREFIFKRGGKPGPHITIPYLESSGTQYLDTGIQLTSTMNIRTSFTTINNGINNARIYGANKGHATDNAFSMYFNTTNGLTFETRRGTHNIKSTGVMSEMLKDFTTNHYMEITKGFDVNGVHYENTNVFEMTSSQNMLVFAYNSVNITNYSSIRLKRFTIEDGENIVMDLIPVQKNDGTYCAYDTISEQYFYNQGTGTFNVSPVVRKQATHKSSLWSWQNDGIDKVDEILSLKNKFNLDMIYQHYHGNNIDYSLLNTFVGTMKSNKIDTSIVYGEPSWYNSIPIMKQFIDYLISYNESYSNKINTLVFDVEPHTIDDPNTTVDERYQILCNNSKEICDYANEHGINLIWCLPAWLDSLYIEQLKQNANGLCYMNYSKVSAVTRFNLFMAQAVLYGYWFENATEYGNPEVLGISEGETFWNEGIDGANDQHAELIELSNNYNKLAFSYHYLDALIELNTNS